MERFAPRWSWAVAVMVGLGVAVGGCAPGKPDPGPPTSPAPKPTLRPPLELPPDEELPVSVLPGDTNAGAIVVLGIAFPMQAGWHVVPPATPEGANFVRIPPTMGGPPGSCSIEFSRVGGTPESAMQLMGAQVIAPPIAPNTTSTDVSFADGLRVTASTFQGSVTDPLTGAQQSGWLMRASIIETPQGLLVVKLKGPASAAQVHIGAYNAMIAGLQKL